MLPRPRSHRAGARREPVPTPTIALSPNLSASCSIPAIAFGVLMVTSMLGTPPSRRALVMSINWSFDLARITATTPASDILARICSLDCGMESSLKRFPESPRSDEKWYAHRPMRRLLLIFLLLPPVAVSAKPATAPGTLPSTKPAFEIVGSIDAPEIPESSGIVESRKYPGVFWTHNDSGNPAEVFAIAASGKLLMKFSIRATMSIGKT